MGTDRTRKRMSSAYFATMCTRSKPENLQRGRVGHLLDDRHLLKAVYFKALFEELAAEKKFRKYMGTSLHLGAKSGQEHKLRIVLPVL